MYEHFKNYMKTQKKNFHENQFGVPYRWMCEHDNIPNDYDEMRFEVMMYESRINGMRKEI